MKVLHLPQNIASQISVSVRALRDIGVEARGLVWGNATIQDPAGVRVYNSRRRYLFHYLVQRTRFVLALRAAIRWADVIHYHWLRPCLRNALDLRWIARSGKPRIVEVWGSDIRKREVASADNPYLARFFASHPDFGCDSQGSRHWQGQFARHGFALLVSGRELLRYVEGGLFDNVYETAARVLLAEFEPKYPNGDCRQPLVVHSPSRPELKGTDAVLAAIEQLRAKHDFEFGLLHQVAHGEAMATVQGCDIFLDQFVLGGYGLASIEAMAFGKPVICYIKDTTDYPDDLPVVNATQESLPAVLDSLLADAPRRQQLGRAGRTYVERHHDARQIARQLVGIYEELIEKNRNRESRVCR